MDRFAYGLLRLWTASLMDRFAYGVVYIVYNIFYKKNVFYVVIYLKSNNNITLNIIKINFFFFSCI